MPRRKRYVPIAQDLNEDDEVWELTDRFGDRALRLWIEICALLDREDNRWQITEQSCKAMFRKCRIAPANGFKIVSWTLKKGWLAVPDLSPAAGSPTAGRRPGAGSPTAGQPAANGSPTILGAPNFWKFHNNHVPEKFFCGAPPILSFLSVSSQKTEKRPPEAASPRLVEEENREPEAPKIAPAAPVAAPTIALVPPPAQRFDTGKFIAIAKRLCGNDIPQLDRMVQQILSWKEFGERHKEPIERTNAVVTAALTAFEREYVAGGRPVARLWGLLDKIYNEERTKFIQGPEHEANKQQVDIAPEVRALIAGIG